MIKKLLFTLICFYLFTVTSTAQVVTYNFTKTDDTYQQLINPSQVVASGWDDNVNFLAFPANFSFKFNDILYTGCGVSSNGAISFTNNSNFQDSKNYNPISSNQAYAGIISALGMDLINNGSEVSYQFNGISPNQILTVQWKDARRKSGSTTIEGNFNFQIKLYETSNKIEVVYGLCATSVTTDLKAQVGLRGANNSDFNNRRIVSGTNEWTTSTEGTFNTTTCDAKAGLLPTSGLTYTWIPQCTNITIHAITGSTTNYCNNQVGSSIGLSGSEIDVFYQLKIGKANAGSPILGTGAAINFGNFNNTGIYTVEASRKNRICAISMNGSVIINTYSTTPKPTAVIKHVICPTDSNGAITINNALKPASLAFLSTDEDYIDFKQQLLSNRLTFTVEGWIKFDKANYKNRMSLFGQNDAIEIAFESGKLRCWTLSGGSVEFPLSDFPEGNQWNHIAVTGSGQANGLKIYLNGVLKGVGGLATSNYGNSSFTTKIGYNIMDPIGQGVGLTGEVFKLGFWNVALSQNEITSMAKGFVDYNASQIGLLAGYNFSEGNGRTLAGVGSLAPIGEFHNTPVWTDPYTYSWTSSVSGFSSNSINLTNLFPGTYYLTTSLKECSNIESFTVNSNSEPEITTTAIVSELCQSTFVQKTKMAYSAAIGEPTSYSIDWLTLTDQFDTSFAFLAGGGQITEINIPAGTIAGTYSGIMTLKNKSGCKSTKSITLTINPLPLAPTATVTQQPTCSIKSGTITVNTAQDGFTYSIDGSDYSNADGTFPELLTGVYSITSKNASGCISAPVMLTVKSIPLKTWNGSAGTDWHIASNWTPNGVPTSGDCVTIHETANQPIISGTSSDNFPIL